MKLLRNPVVVGVLAVLALLYMAWTILGARGFRSYLATAATTTAKGPAVSVPLAPLPTNHRTNLPAIPSANRTALRSEAPRWIESPRRDPFRLLAPVAPVPEGPNAAELLVLRAVWRQSGAQLAIINQQILMEGDHLAGYDIEAIEPDLVWVRGTNGRGRESITFAMAGAPAGLAPSPSPATASTPLTETMTATIPVAPRK